MAVAPRSASVGSNTSGSPTAIVVTKPAGTVDGDYLLAFVIEDSAGAGTDITAPAGWTQTGSTITTGIRAKVFGKVASGEGASFSYGCTSYSSCSAMAIVVAFTGVDPITPLNVAASLSVDATGNSKSAVAPSITPSSGVGAVVFGFATQGQSSNTAMSTPSGLTSILQSRSPADSFAGELIAWKAYTTATATGTQTSTYATSNSWSTFSVALNAASSGTPANVTASPAAATGTTPIGGITAGASVAGDIASATASTPTGTVESRTGASVTADPVVASAMTPAGGVTAAGGAIVSAPTVVATGSAPQGSVTALAIIPATVTAPTVTAAASVPVGTLTHTLPPPPPARIPSLSRSAGRKIRQRLFLADGETGQIVGDLPFTGVPAWTRQLNDPGSFSASIPLFSELDDTMKRRLAEPWRWIMAYAEDGVVRQCGWIVSATADDKPDSVAAISTKTIWDFLSAKRRVENTGADISTSAADVIFSPTSPDPANQNLSLHSIARRLVEMASTGSLTLPITLPDPIAGTAQRSYAGADLGMTGARLDELTQVINGPEVEFSPEFVDDSQTYITLRMRIGNSRLGQLGFPHHWDHGKALVSLNISMDGADMTFDVIAKGQDTRQAAEGDTPASGALTWARNSYVSPYPAAGWPVLQTADTTHSDVTIQDTIQGYADADVKSGERPVYTATAVIRNNGLDNLGRDTGSPSVGQVSVGDTGVITVDRHPWLTPGDYSIRILSVGSGQDAYTSSLTLQLLI